ncbi:ATP-binding cassette domain-containing protein [Bacillus cereus]|uniref:ATP-binding cassette domain-containing protein n=1 Tax=Bacillus cereus group TaxID=86661 RepID=UPI000AD3AE54|nr:MULTISPECIES: ABC transporter ATP-binding protein [Bacillus cereus group]MDZ4489974.1 ABC transporter ATP-binding protein [Bacillus cereus]MDZ4572433.1 ABC transporter ATP-binding protein [Bacillus cereus]MEB9660410.1 ABC transporter ATP-binding protein [Bacillus cereus]MEB9975513.1 ABC transporter ATP-binding protein [Bacillus cereus]NSL61688.1 ABC transporter ATP-binding protein [Bacillus cereus]
MSIEITNLSKNFNKRERVLDSINMNIKNGEIVGLVGPNGAGKTTLMKIISGLIVQYNGEIKFSQEEYTQIGSLIEKPKYFPNKSGYYNLKYFSQLYSDKDNNIEEIIHSLQMENYLSKKVKDYSLGMKQRLGIALALLNNPNYLILDEPTNGMDPNGIKSILKYIKGLAKKKNIGVLLSSHILDDVADISDRVYLINKGQIINEYSSSITPEKTIKFIFNQEIIIEATNILSYFGLVEKTSNTISLTTDKDLKILLEKLGEKNIYPQDIDVKKDTLEEFYFKNIGAE